MALSHAHKSALTLSLVLACYLLSVHLPENFFGTINLILMFSTNPWGTPSLTLTILQNLAFYSYLLTPTILLIVAMLALTKQRAIRLAKTVAFISYTFMVLSFCEIFFATFMFLKSTPAAIATQVATALSIFLWHWTILLLARQVRDAPATNPKMTLKSWIVIAPVLTLMAWSLTAGAVTALQSTLLAKGQPYCIASSKHSENSSSLDIKSLEMLRGVRFHTDRTGYKMNSQFYFHAILIVDGQDGRQYWFWSIHKMKFERLLHPERQVVWPTHACKPRQNFISHLSLF